MGKFVKTISVIAATSYAFNESIQKLRAIGMHAHVAKPITPRLLFHSMHYFFARQ